MSLDTSFKLLSSRWNSFSSQVKIFFSGSDTMVRENALEILGLSENEAQDKNLLDARYNKLCESWKKKILKANQSPVIAEKLKEQLKKTHIAYKTLNIR